MVGQFAVAALYERRNLLNQKPAVTDRRYKKTKVTHYRGLPGLERVILGNVATIAGLHAESLPCPNA